MPVHGEQGIGMAWLSIGGFAGKSNVGVDYMELGRRFEVGVEDGCTDEVNPSGHAMILRQP